MAGSGPAGRAGAAPVRPGDGRLTMRRIRITRPPKRRPDPGADLDLRSPSGRRLPY
ncbi:hypothetical protein HD595_005774 [Nonomuraea roseoviolacea subsp. carminata]|uniref:Uncharacterized protein n=1 Tax=Nonomuraea roseoviolacea subsp. carminata TaxID=160689 RepID=A0ABT1K6L8_9ACTN|nr:hypothetical protein [Nonomuraea roseoviolacea subsp. carminata]